MFWTCVQCQTVYIIILGNYLTKFTTLGEYKHFFLFSIPVNVFCIILCI